MTRLADRFELLTRWAPWAEPAPGLSEADLRVLFDSALDAVVVLDAQGRIVVWNRRAVQMFGWAAPEVLLGDLDRILPGAWHDDRHGWSERRPLRNRRVRLQARHRDGHEIPVELTLSSLGGGRRRFFSAFLRDLSEELRAERRVTTELAVVRILAGAESTAQAAPQLLSVLAEALHFDVGELWHVDPDQRRLVLGGRWPLLTDQETTPSPMWARGEGLPGRVWASGLEAWVADLHRDADFPRQTSLQAGERRRLRSGLLLPLADGARQVRGVLALYASHQHEPDVDRRRQLAGLARKIGEFIARDEGRNELWRLRKAVDALQIGVTLTDVQGRIVYTNPGEARMHGYQVGELLGEPARRLAPPHLWAPSAIGQLRGYKSWRRESIGVRRDGSEFPVQRISDIVTNRRGEPVGVVTCTEDITERRRAEERIEFLALHDALTGLPNRNLFRDRLGQVLANADRADLQSAVMFLDLDGFKQINDALGHTAGDQLLEAIARRLVESLRGEDTVGRVGGDEFTILLAPLARDEDVAIVADKLLAAVARPLQLAELDLRVTASIGIALYPRDGTDAETLLRHADRALYRAKDSGRNNYQFFSAHGEVHAARRLAMESSIHGALEQNEIEVHFQPQARLADGRVVLVEALARWHNAAWGWVPPEEFIPLAEHSSAVLPLGEWVLRRSCELARQWPATDGAELRVAVNLSPIQLRQAGLPRLVESVLEASGLEPQRLELEITESVAMHNLETTLHLLRELHAMDVTLTVDDFGTGHSSLNYLRLLPVDRLKIDRSFVHDVLDEERSLALVHAMIAMAHSLGLSVVAEGVESPRQLKLLRQLGCDAVQGFLLSRPLSASALNARLQNGPAHLSLPEPGWFA